MNSQATKPVLYLFAISHFCEKARWALDYLDIEFEPRHVAPGLHMVLAKKLGAPASSVPILVADGQLVQGSAAIVDWADAVAPRSKHLTPEIDREQCVALEKRLDDVIGVHIRRYYYSEALVEYPQTVKPIFAEKLSYLQKRLMGVSWGAVRKVMIKAMDLGPQQGEEAMRIIDAEMKWLDDLLSDGRQFLTGKQFSRADIAAASLLAPLAAPKQHPTYANMALPPNIADDMVDWKNRRVINWVREIYDQYR